MAGIAFAGEAFPEQLGAPDEAAVEFIAEVAAEPAEAAVEPAEVVIHEAAEDAKGRKRARHPKGSGKGGEFVGDDPATPENEAFEDGKATIRG